MPNCGRLGSMNSARLVVLIKYWYIVEMNSGEAVLSISLLSNSSGSSFVFMFSSWVWSGSPVGDKEEMR